MFLDKYVLEVDEQLARLIAARDKIASLAGPVPDFKTEFKYEALLPIAAVAEEPKMESVEPEAMPVALKAEAVEAPETVATPAKRRGRPKGSRNKTTMIRTRRTATPEPRALTNTVPTGPVVVSPAQLAKRQEVVVAKPQAPAPKPETPGGGLDALIRELTDRRVTAFSPAA
jgi:hypothetical protein